MSRNWLWLIFGLVVVGLVLAGRFFPPTSPKEKQEQEAHTTHQLPTQEEWLAGLQAGARMVAIRTGKACSFGADFKGAIPTIIVRWQDVTEQYARAIADGIAGRYFLSFPNADKVAVSVKEWNNLEEIYFKLYERGL